MSAIGPGDWVEFIGRPDGYVNPALEIVSVRGVLIPGAIYPVLEVGRRVRDGAGQIWDSIVVRGAPLRPDGRITAVPLAAFKPVSGGRPGMFAHLLKQPSSALGERETA